MPYKDKELKKIKDREYYDKNRASLLEYAKKYRNENSEIIKINQAIIREQNREKIRVSDREKYKINPEPKIYNNMIQRCYNEKHDRYSYYGGRGIIVCDRWRFGEGGKTGIQCFLEDMGKRPSYKHSIDRIENDGNYEPNNCKWSTQIEQIHNRRKYEKKIK